MANEENIQTANEPVEPVETVKADATVDAEPTEAVESAPDTAAELAALSAELEAARAEVSGLQDQLLRSAAEVQNVRRRAEQDVEKAHKFALEKFATIFTKS